MPMPNVVPRVDQLIGQVIDDGRLCLVEPLGHGSGGVVFRALDLFTTSHFAVKCMLKAEPGSRQATFQKREIRLHSSVSSHPSVLTLHRVIEEDSYIFIVLDYCAGGDLFKFLTRQGTFVRKDALVKDAMCQLIDGLEHCHARGVYHRDIKPENIMCNKDGTQLKLGDFGLATDIVCSKNFGAGTSGYMSPECIGTEMGHAGYKTAANDVWSLGIILTSMISGHNPWRRAVMTDDCFRSYIRNPDFFRLMLPISAAANAILVDIFAPSEMRITLPVLRKRILAADTLFLTDDQIAHASKFVQLAAASYLAENTAPASSTPGPSDEVPLKLGDGVAVRKTTALKERALMQAVDPKPDELGKPMPVEDDIADIRIGVRKRVAPQPQRMPSFGDLMQTSSASSLSDTQARTRQTKTGRKPRMVQSPGGLFKRFMDKVFVKDDKFVSVH